MGGPRCAIPSRERRGQRVSRVTAARHAGDPLRRKNEEFGGTVVELAPARRIERNAPTGQELTEQHIVRIGRAVLMQRHEPDVILAGERDRLLVGQGDGAASLRRPYGGNPGLDGRQPLAIGRLHLGGR
jgi:hypothetical protein